MIEGIDYTFVTVEHNNFDEDALKAHRMPVPTKTYSIVKKKRSRKHMSDETLMAYVNEYNEHGYIDLPMWLQFELNVRNIKTPRREPTMDERFETIHDEREHRITNRELTLNDYKDKYMYGKSITVVD